MSEDYSGQQTEFTETAYRALLRLAAREHRFIGFGETGIPGKTVLWRHDIDFSPHRARALARIESEEGVTATYFVLLHSDFYNAMEHAVRDVLMEISSLGHRIGLHFDATFYRDLSPERLHAVEQYLQEEKRILAYLIGVPVTSFSWHVPSMGGWDQLVGEDRLAGMVNAYGRDIRSRFAYCSDSHGIWRFRRPAEMLADPSIDRLQLLTHPEWWVPDPLTPRQRVSRAIEGRASRQGRNYDELLERLGRPNVR